MAISIFISYSRTNSAFVDRLEADLQARSFQVWVDRRKLEAGQNWMDELQKAIDRCHVLLIALSPEAAESKYVRMEYRYAQSQSKIILPLEYQTCPKVPIDLNGIQWVDFKAAYEQGLSSLLVALSQMTPAPLVPPARTAQLTPPPAAKEPALVTAQPAPPPPDADLNMLYRMGVVAKAEGDLERAATLWQQVLDRDPDFGHKTLATFMDQLQQQLQPLRIQRLKELALQAHRNGTWGQEIGAWQALLGLEPQNAEAGPAISIAQANLPYAWMYENAVEFAQEGHHAAVKEQLSMLWQVAPDYGDPAGLAGKLRALALQAHEAGAWGQEIGAWQALLGLNPRDDAAKWAISIAKTNLQHAWRYEKAAQFARAGQATAAKEQLDILWQEAPDYGDPVKIIEKLGILRLKKSYDFKTTDMGSISLSKEKPVSGHGFSSITQSGYHVKGYFYYGVDLGTMGMGSSSVFEGTIDDTGNFVFMVAKAEYLSPLKMAGKVQSDGRLVGTWESLDNPSDHGTWEAR